MNLKSITQVKKTKVPNLFDVTLITEDNGVETSQVFSYFNTNPETMQAQIYKWLKANPDFEITEFVEDTIFNPDAERARIIKRIIDMCNAITSSIVMSYPEAEVQTWTIQKYEANRFLDAYPNSDLSMAPFITTVCSMEFGPASVDDRMSQVHDKCVSVKDNANSWAIAAATINGLRSRAEKMLDNTNTLEGLLQIETEIIGQISSLQDNM